MLIVAPCRACACAICSRESSATPQRIYAPRAAKRVSAPMLPPRACYFHDALRCFLAPRYAAADDAFAMPPVFVTLISFSLVADCAFTNMSSLICRRRRRVCCTPRRAGRRRGYRPFSPAPDMIAFSHFATPSYRHFRYATRFFADAAFRCCRLRDIFRHAAFTLPLIACRRAMPLPPPPLPPILFLLCRACWRMMLRRYVRALFTITRHLRLPPPLIVTPPCRLPLTLSMRH